MPACAIIGGDPLHIFASAATVKAKSGYDVVSSLRGEPIELVKGQLTGLPFPAAAEIVLEGEIDPQHLRNEGPFGEYPLYYTRLGPMPWLQVTAVTMRKQPIYVDVFNAHKEHLVLGALPRMGRILRRTLDGF